MSSGRRSPLAFISRTNPEKEKKFPGPHSRKNNVIKPEGAVAKMLTRWRYDDTRGIGKKSNGIMVPVSLKKINFADRRLRDPIVFQRAIPTTTEISTQTDKIESSVLALNTIPDQTVDSSAATAKTTTCPIGPETQKEAYIRYRSTPPGQKHQRDAKRKKETPEAKAQRNAKKRINDKIRKANKSVK